MTRSRRRRLSRALLPIGVIVSYVLLREYADAARSLEAVLGLFHGNAAWHTLVAASVLFLRVAAYGVVGGLLLAWPLEEYLLRRAGSSPD